MLQALATLFPVGMNPCGHVRQEVPSAAEYFPVGHEVQLAEPGWSENEPNSPNVSYNYVQSTQDPPELFFPAGHCEQGVPAEPAGQLNGKQAGAILQVLIAALPLVMLAGICTLPNIMFEAELVTAKMLS